jgi:hypothetical protein
MRTVEQNCRTTSDTAQIVKEADFQNASILRLNGLSESSTDRNQTYTIARLPRYLRCMLCTTRQGTDYYPPKMLSRLVGSKNETRQNLIYSTPFCMHLQSISVKAEVILSEKEI